MKIAKKQVLLKIKIQGGNYFMYKYEDVIKDIFNGENYKVREEQLQARCPFHNDHKPSFGINLETGCFNCFSCSEKGNILEFISKYKNISISEAKLFLQENYNIDVTNLDNTNTYSVDDYCKEKKLDRQYLESLNLSNSSNGLHIEIPYFDINGEYVNSRCRASSNSKMKFWWKKKSQTTLYRFVGIA